jgi:CheY-like chemotaxis protein
MVGNFCGSLQRRSGPPKTSIRHCYAGLLQKLLRANVDLVEQIPARHGNLRLYSANNGLKGISMAHSHRPHVILMDVHLPGMSGREALHILRQDLATRHIPTIAVGEHMGVASPAP